MINSHSATDLIERSKAKIAKTLIATAAAVLSVSLSTSAHAAMNLERAIYVCKSEVQQQLATIPGELRVKFKGVHGTRSAKKLRLQVIGDAEGPYIAICTIDTSHYGQVSLQKEQ